MSHDIFQILDCNHTKFLQRYTDQNDENLTKADVFRQSLECRNLLQQINDICNSYTLGNNWVYYPKITRENAARKIYDFFLRTRNRNIYAQTKSMLYKLSRKDPLKVLELVNTSHAELFEKTMCKLVFRLDGINFPPSIVYKIFSEGRHITLQSRLYRNMVIVNGNLGWFIYSVYKCNSCKSKVKVKSMHTKKSKKKVKEDRQISWINQMYG
ncbi:unnamed protein product [Acanthoscelides obtectus]|uniref:Uncharacterized protein n=1 Tax=Acanthoscelides obtectus TaxID=200917 RepID=A0A9P0LCC8_ACAOB|nr:unnamed protein product [Acanthoscelides obtectus]CAK1664929.1 hypothetical protein AOBTE_LOCUS24557 [Acanthoscelides obtectus]